MTNHLDTLLHAVGVQANLGNAVHHSGWERINLSPHQSINYKSCQMVNLKTKKVLTGLTGDLSNASPALSVLADSVVGVAGRLHCRL